MSDTSVGIGTKRTRTSRERVSMVRFAQDFVRSDPEVFRPYEPLTICEAMKEAGLPQTAIDDAIIFWLQMHRRDLDPDYERFPKVKPKTKEQREAKRKAAAAAAAQRREIIAAAITDEQNIMARTIGPDMVMDDGRRLGDWTIGELRKLNALFAFILDKAGSDDDTRTVDTVMKARDWKAASKA